jgi:hypothetical protein
MMVDSSATTGWWAARAALTVADISISGDGTARYAGLPGRSEVRLGPLPRLGDGLAGGGRVVADDDDRARSGAEARPDDRAGSVVFARAAGGAAEDQHVGVARVIKQDACREPFGDLGAHADAGIQADRVANRLAQDLTDGAPAPAGVPLGRHRIAGELMAGGFQREDGVNLGGA